MIRPLTDQPELGAVYDSSAVPSFHPRIKATDRLPVHELSTVNGQSLRFKCRATPGVSSAEVQAESQREQLQLPLKATRKHPGRQELPAELSRTEQLIACTPEQCVCGKCGKQTIVIGYETAEQLDVEPAKYFVRVTKREKRACKDCEEQGGVAIAGGQKTTLSQSGIGQSQRAKSFAVEFLVYVESIIPVGIEVGVALRRQMRHTGVIDMLAFCLQLSRLRS